MRRELSKHLEAWGIAQPAKIVAVHRLKQYTTMVRLAWNVPDLDRFRYVYDFYLDDSDDITELFCAEVCESLATCGQVPLEGEFDS